MDAGGADTCIHFRGDTSTGLAAEPWWGDPRVFPKAVLWLGGVRSLPFANMK